MHHTTQKADRLNQPLSNRFNQMLLAGIATVALTGAVLPAQAAECNREEVGYVATFKINEGSEAAFEKAIAELAATVNRVEPGVVLYAPFKGTDNTYYMMERYQNEAARVAHATSSEVQALFPGLGPHMAGAPDVQPVSAVCP
jgi:quinol monooxygenase YgiN